MGRRSLAPAKRVLPARRWLSIGRFTCIRTLFGSPAALGPPSSTRRPVALRPRLSAGLPFRRFYTLAVFISHQPALVKTLNSWV